MNERQKKLNLVLSELEGETLIDANLLMENEKCRKAIEDFVDGKLPIESVMETINNSF